MRSLTLAMATGRISKQAITFLEQAGIIFPDFHNKSRKLVIYDTTRQIKLIFVKTTDLCTYVEKGAADVGIIGKDTLMEEQSDVYELLDFKFGLCKLVVAGFPEQDFNHRKRLMIASKYPAIAESYFNEKGQRAEVIKLNGSVELAPLIGLSDIIVDIVESGTTLKENGLVVLDEIMDISSRLIVNKASYATKTTEIQRLIDKLTTVKE